MVMAGYTSSEREAARAIAVKNKTIFWHNNQGEGGIADKYSFFTGPIPEQQILTGIEFMIKKYGPENVYFGRRLRVRPGQRPVDACRGGFEWRNDRG